MNAVKFWSDLWRRLLDGAHNTPAVDAAANDESPTSASAVDKERHAVLGTVAAVLGGLVLLVGWAAFVPLHRGASAPGKVQQQSARGVVQHMDGGIVERLLVKEGDLVRQDQLLVKLDDRAANIALELLTGQHRLLLIEQAMLNAELNDQAQITWPAELLGQNDPKTQRAMLAATQLLHSKAADDAAQKAVLSANIDRLRANVVGIEAQRVGRKEQARLIRTELEALQSLYDKRLVPKPRLLALQRTAADLDSSIATSVASIAQAQVQMGEARMKMLQIDTQGGQEAAQRLQQIQSKLFELRDRINSQKLILARTEIRSPVEGLVLRRAVTSPGQVLRPGDPVLDIVPADRLIVTAMAH